MDDMIKVKIASEPFFTHFSNIKCGHFFLWNNILFQKFSNKSTGAMPVDDDGNFYNAWRVEICKPCIFYNADPVQPADVIVYACKSNTYAGEIEVV